MEIEIDIIVPIYNVEKYIYKCLESLVNQTIPVNIILINDGSTDDSYDIAKSFLQKYNNIKMITTENRGLSAARNEGLKYAKSSYISFMDSDDWVEKNYYEKMLNTIKSNNADLCCSDIIYFYNNKRQLIKKANSLDYETIKNDNNSYKNNIINIFPMMQNKLWKNTNIFKKYFFLEGTLYEDLDFFYRIYPYLKCICFCKYSKFYYRQHDICLTKNFNKVKDIIRISDNIYNFYIKNDLLHQYNEEINYLIIRNCLYASIKRLSYSNSYYIINSYSIDLYNYINNRLPNWKKNIYLRKIRISNIILKMYSGIFISFFSFILSMKKFIRK